MSEPKQITSLYAWIASEAGGDDGIPGIELVIDGQCMMMPLIGADMERIESLRPAAANIKVETGVRMRLCRFQLADELEEL